MEDVLLPEIDDTLKAIDTALEELEREEAVRSPGLGKRDRITPELPIPACGPTGTAVLRITPLSRCVISRDVCYL